MRWLNPYTWLLYGSLMAALLLGAWRVHHNIDQGGYDRADAEWQAKVNIQQADATKLLDEERAKVAAASMSLRNFKDNQEIKDAANKTTVSGYERRLRAAAGPAGRLRDPNASYATGCGGGGGNPQGADTATAGHRADDVAEAAGLFSVGATALLQRLTREGDDINLAYTSCRADALSIRGSLPIHK
jgi:hypothetical protein